MVKVYAEAWREGIRCFNKIGGHLTQDKGVEYKWIFHFIRMFKGILSQMQKIAATKVKRQKNSNLIDSLWLRKTWVTDPAQ